MISPRERNKTSLKPVYINGRKRDRKTTRDVYDLQKRYCSHNSCHGLHFGRLKRHGTATRRLQWRRISPWRRCLRDFGDPFFYYLHPYYGYYPYVSYPYDYGYNSYAEPAYQGSAEYTDPLTGQCQ